MDGTNRKIVLFTSVGDVPAGQRVEALDHELLALGRQLQFWCGLRGEACVGMARLDGRVDQTDTHILDGGED